MTIQGQLERKLYERVNLALSAVGGVWNRHKGAHLFPVDAAEAIAGLLATGEVTTDAERGFFPTPPLVVDQLLATSELAAGMVVLEPSAGRGAIAERAADLGAVVDCIEIDPDRAEYLRASGYSRSVTTGDFLQQPVTRSYERALLNPPFANQQDIRHVIRAERFVKPGGLVVAVMSAGITFRNDKVSTDFRARIREARGTIDELPEEAFKHSGTSMRTVLVRLPVRDQLPPPRPPRNWARARPEHFSTRPAAMQTGLFAPDDTDSCGTPPFESLE
ncbi:class I SAM-dependent methyltransferase [Streptomyces spiramyceticus]|uniref:class I SAM-dependent methyltransferase n=1 Tax=Streptomyces spiramyceticus TaxID=299717 RepID=UPI00237BDFB0|nr:class I SAM-dependent methyltransferase [Streptomyces spiramyceticus]